MPWSRCLSALTCKNNYGTCFRVSGFWMGITNATLKTDIAMCLLYLSKRETSDANKANIQKENDMRLNPPTFIFFLCFFASRKLFVPIFVPPNKMYGMHNERTRNVFMICEILIRLQSADRLARSVNLHTLFNNSSQMKSLSNLFNPFINTWPIILHSSHNLSFIFDFCRCQKFQMQLQTPPDRKCLRFWKAYKSISSTQPRDKMSLIPVRAASKRHHRLRQHHRHNRQVSLAQPRLFLLIYFCWIIAKCDMS